MWLLYSARCFRAEELIAAITEPTAEPCQPEDILRHVETSWSSIMIMRVSSDLVTGPVWNTSGEPLWKINTQVLDFFPTSDNGQAELARSCLTYLLRV